jgi:hypothetical protein
MTVDQSPGSTPPLLGCHGKWRCLNCDRWAMGGDVVYFIGKSSPRQSEDLFETLPKMARSTNETGAHVHFDSDACLPQAVVGLAPFAREAGSQLRWHCGSPFFDRRRRKV